MSSFIVGRTTGQAACTIPLPSPTLTNPEMILPFFGSDSPSSSVSSPSAMHQHVFHTVIDSASSITDQRQAHRSIVPAQMSSSSPLSRSPGHSLDASSVNSDDIESLNWSRFDGATETGSDIDDEDEERFGSFPWTSESDLERWDTTNEGPHPPYEDAYSSAALSRRADIILANAKKRLSVRLALRAEILPCKKAVLCTVKVDS
jgi:hypothetical protein